MCYKCRFGFGKSCDCYKIEAGLHSIAKIVHTQKHNIFLIPSSGCSDNSINQSSQSHFYSRHLEAHHRIRFHHLTHQAFNAMALRQLSKVWVGIATGAAATGAAHCAEQDKYFDPDALERGAKVCSTRCSELLMAASTHSIHQQHRLNSISKPFSFSQFIL